jgi:hypothetical protein
VSARGRVRGDSHRRAAACRPPQAAGRPPGHENQEVWNPPDKTSQITFIHALHQLAPLVPPRQQPIVQLPHGGVPRVACRLDDGQPIAPSGERAGGAERAARLAVERGRVEPVQRLRDSDEVGAARGQAGRVRVCQPAGCVGPGARGPVGSEERSRGSSCFQGWRSTQTMHARPREGCRKDGARLLH